MCFELTLGSFFFSLVFFSHVFYLFFLQEGYVRYTTEMKYNLLFVKPPAWGLLPDWEIGLDDPAIIPYTVGSSGKHEIRIFWRLM